MAEKAILYDPSRCTACRGCQAACKQWWELPGETTTNIGSYENPPDLGANTWVKMKFTELERKGSINWLFTRRSCMHCTDAPCVTVCPTGALYHHELGFVDLNKDLCIGCGYCREFCPFDVPRFSGNALTATQKADKCIFCRDRVSNGLEPSCVKTCPPQALAYGDRDKMVAEGRKRVAALKQKGFANAYLYGEKEIGGLHVLYVLDDSPAVYGLPADPKVPAMAAVWRSIIQPLGYAAVGATVLGLGLNYLVARSLIKSEKEENE
ncbi:MAG: 4Fe-4S dicluster domain-containing protein [Chloroflexi bacterium]|nr:4Fe-4S dicluster domain-containing protein [Chloroflexota bacterium]